VVVGESEDKDMVAARVGWTGAGINLKTRYGSAEQIRNAVRAILTTKQYRDEAQRLRAKFSRYNALDELARTVDAMLTRDGNMARPHLEPDYPISSLTRRTYERGHSGKPEGHHIP
jgi:UDP:flavonoid glycosyltransferase YjiC (YdhE family)